MKNISNFFFIFLKIKLELKIIKETTINQMWLSELDNLKTQYIEYKEERARLMSGEDTKKKKVVSKGPIKKKAALVIE